MGYGTARVAGTARAVLFYGPCAINNDDASLTEIQNFRAGDTLSWTKSSSDYPATDGWTAKYRLSGLGGQIDLTAAADGADFLFTIQANTSADYVAGAYSYAGWVEKGTGPALEKHTLWSGTIDILQDLSALEGASDQRSIARRTLERIDAAILRHATNPVEELEINGRRYKYPSMADLIRFRQTYEKAVRDEDAASNLAQGRPRSKILVRDVGLQ